MRKYEQQKIQYLKSKDKAHVAIRYSSGRSSGSGGNSGRSSGRSSGSSSTLIRLRYGRACPTKYLYPKISEILLCCTHIQNGQVDCFHPGVDACWGDWVAVRLGRSGGGRDGGGGHVGSVVGGDAGCPSSLEEQLLAGGKASVLRASLDGGAETS